MTPIFGARARSSSARYERATLPHRGRLTYVKIACIDARPRDTTKKAASASIQGHLTDEREGRGMDPNARPLTTGYLFASCNRGPPHDSKLHYDRLVAR
jgi:hypothetical protein